MVICRFLTFLLIFLCGNILAENTILAFINDELITSNSIQKKLNFDTPSDLKIIIIQDYIDILLQLKQAKELNLYPLKNEVSLAILKIASDTNISIDQLKSYPEFDSLEQEVINKISLLNLKRFITKNLFISKNKVLKDCGKEPFKKDIKQIKIAQIIISELDSQTSTNTNKDNQIKSFLNKLAKHISKGASFENFAKLYSQHISYVNGGKTEWIEVNSPILIMLDSLSDNEVSEIYKTDFGFTIGIKLDERFINSNFTKCKEKLIYLNAEKFYSNWVNDLRSDAYIKIYYDKL